MLSLTSELRVSGLMNQGVPSKPKSRLGREEGSKSAASPKSAADGIGIIRVPDSNKGSLSRCNSLTKLHSPDAQSFVVCQICQDIGYLDSSANRQAEILANPRGEFARMYKYCHSASSGPWLRHRGITYCFDRGERLVFQEHEIARFHVSMKDIFGVALCNGPEHSAHVTGDLKQKSYRQIQQIWGKH